MNKEKIIEKILEKLTADLEAVTLSAKAAHDAATNEESKAEDAHDTRGLEASYLAGAQKKRALELNNQITSYRLLPTAPLSKGSAIGAGALVELSRNGKSSYYFLVGDGGGITIEMDGKRINVVSAKSPMGEELLDRKESEIVELEVQNSLLEYVILKVI